MMKSNNKIMPKDLSNKNDPHYWEDLPDCKNCHGKGSFGGWFGWICEECEGMGKDYSKKQNKSIAEQ